MLLRAYACLNKARLRNVALTAELEDLQHRLELPALAVAQLIAHMQLSRSFQPVAARQLASCWLIAD